MNRWTTLYLSVMFILGISAITMALHGTTVGGILAHMGVMLITAVLTSIFWTDKP